MKNIYDDCQKTQKVGDNLSVCVLNISILPPLVANMSCESGNVKYLICLMTSQDYVIEGSRDAISMVVKICSNLSSDLKRPCDSRAT